jgi:hypothetical protein
VRVPALESAARRPPEALGRTTICLKLWQRLLLLVGPPPSIAGQPLRLQF